MQVPGLVLGVLLSLYVAHSFQLRSPRAQVGRDRVIMLQDGKSEGFESKRGARVPIEKIPSMFDDGSIIEGINAGLGGEKSEYYDDE